MNKKFVYQVGNNKKVRKNKLTYIVASCWLLSQLDHDARIHERQIILIICIPLHTILDHVKTLSANAHRSSSEL
jgi:hypothetical protein